MRPWKWELWPWNWRKVRKARISKEDRDLFERYGESVIGTRRTRTARTETRNSRDWRRRTHHYRNLPQPLLRIPRHLRRSPAGRDSPADEQEHRGHRSADSKSSRRDNRIPRNPPTGTGRPRKETEPRTLRREYPHRQSNDPSHSPQRPYSIHRSP